MINTAAKGTRKEKACVFCNAIFKPRKGRESQEYCSIECKHKDFYNKNKRQCPVCGIVFKAKNWGDRGFQKYCSFKCKAKGWENQVELICENCGEKFTVKKCIADKRKFCSKKCYGINKSKTQGGKRNPAWKGGISRHTLGSGKNTSRKGRYYENLARRELEKAGFYVVRSAASKGIWDLVGMNADFIILVQTKVTRIPRIKERKAMEDFVCPKNSIKQYWRFFGYGRWEIFTWIGNEWKKED